MCFFYFMLQIFFDSILFSTRFLSLFFEIFESVRELKQCVILVAFQNQDFN